MLSLLRPGPLATALVGLGCLLSRPACAGSPHEAPTPRPFSQPAPLAQELRHKMQSPLVRELQVRLRHAKYLALYDVDDRYGLQTREAVRKFQKDHGLRPTGIVDQATWDRLLPRSHQPTAAELNNTDVGPWFTGPGQVGYMKELQHRLMQLGHYQGSVDGRYDAATQQALQNPAVKTKFEALSFIPVGSSPKEFAAFQANEYKTYEKVIKAIKARGANTAPRT